MSLSTTFLIFGVFLLMGAIGWGIYAAILIFKDRPKSKDNPVLLNFAAMKYGEGAFLSTVMSSEIAVKGRNLLEITPRDVDEQIEVEPIIVDKNFLESYPKGTLSKRKNFLIALPPNEESMSESFKNTKLGKALIWAVETENMVKSQIKIMEEQGKRRDEIAKEFAGGELSVEYLSFVKNLVKDMMNIQKGKMMEKGDSKMTPPLSEGLTL